MSDDVFFGEPQVGPVADAHEGAAVAELEKTLEAHRARVFFSRQLEIWHEARWFHWITNRALRDLADAGIIVTEVRPLRTGNTVTLMWHRSYRYPKREAASPCTRGGVCGPQHRHRDWHPK